MNRHRLTTIEILICIAAIAIAITIVIKTIMEIKGVTSIKKTAYETVLKPRTWHCEVMDSEHLDWGNLKRCRPQYELGQPVCPAYGELWQDGWCYPD